MRGCKFRIICGGMISYLHGKVLHKDLNYFEIDVNGVGYKVFSKSTFINTLTFNDVISVFIYTNVKEDDIKLFGFENREEKIIFEVLISVSGVGPKTALAILNSTSVNGIKSAIQNADTEVFMNVSGIGKKLAQKIIVELQSKIGKITELNLKETNDEDVINALKNLGYTYKEAHELSKGVDKNLEIREKIKLSLKNTNGKR